MKKLILHIVLIGALSACTQSGVGPRPTPTPDPAPGQPAPYSVTGVALDTQGRPLAGAKVWIDAAYGGVAEVYTDADGHYLVTGLPRGPFYAKAWIEVDYNGQYFCLRLGMPSPRDYDSFTAEVGVVRNFQWQLSGVIEDLREYDGYFGGDVRLFEYGNFESGVVELTFTPTAPLVDGSAGQVLTRTLSLPEEFIVRDIPLGLYSVTGVLVEAGGVRTPLNVGLEYAETYAEQTEEAALAFKAYGGCGNAGNIERAFLYLNSPYDY